MAGSPDLLARVLAEQARHTVNPLRACELCEDHRRAADGSDLLCASPQVTCGAAVRCTSARAATGRCGPDALLQRWPALQLRAA